MGTYKKLTGINFSMLFRLMGFLMIIECGFMLVPLATCLLYGEGDWVSFGYSIAITGGVGLALTLLLRPRSTDMGKKEGFLLTALVWVVFSLFGMLPFLFGQHATTVPDAFFEAMSGFTTTGASTLTSIDSMSHGQLLWRCLMQWIGGLGIILFTLAVIPMLNKSGGMQMFNAEVTGITHEKIRPRVSQTAKGLWVVYITLTAILIGLLWLGPMDAFESVCHAFSVMSTGGASTSDASIGQWNIPYVKIVLTVFMFIGGVNFSLIFRVGHGDFRGAWKNDILKIFVGVIVVVTVFISAWAFFHGGERSVEGLLIDPLFTVVSMSTSTGYTLGVVEEWGPTVLVVIFVLIFFGGCAGSTSGGAKIDRGVVLFQHCRNEIVRCLYPNAIFAVRVNGRVVSRELISKSVVFLALYVMIILFGTIVITAMGVSMGHAFVATFSCITSAGISTPEMNIDMTFVGLPSAAKWFLSFVMLVGRLELFTVLLLFTSDFWRK